MDPPEIIPLPGSVNADADQAADAKGDDGGNHAKKDHAEAGIEYGLAGKEGDDGTQDE